ncbi:MAG TPA: hypothetical protein VF787_00185 [Thermoanaerobaculia bacterium]
MRKTRIVTLLASFAFLLISCASSEPEPVQVIGVPEDLVPLTGEWVGTYESSALSRSGSIIFHLTENPEGAHGDVLMVPKREYVRNDVERQPPYGMISSSSVLWIEFVRIEGGAISGHIAPYPDPELLTGTLETHFTGRVDGEWIEGTFVTYSDHGVSPRRGTWRVHRKAVR